MIKDLIYPLILLMVFDINTYAEDTCLGKNLTLYQEPDRNNLEAKIRELFPEQNVGRLYENILVLTPHGTCDTVNDISSVIDEKRLISAANRAIKIQNSCKDQRIWSSLGTAGNPYLSIGTCARFSSSPVLVDVNLYEIVQKLNPTTALYKSGSSSYVVYKNKASLPNYLQGIFKQTGVFQLTDSYGRVHQLHEVTKIADFTDKRLLTVKKPMTAKEAALQYLINSQK